MLEVAVTQIDAAIRRSKLVITYELAEMRLSANTGYVEGSVTFTNGARLIFFEFFRQTASETAREKYRYHFMDADNRLIFRYDNAPHHPEVASFPHHKHLGLKIAASSAPQFVEVFVEVELNILGIA